MTSVSLPNSLEIDPVLLKKASLPFRAVNNDFRRKILQLIHQNKQMMVRDIYVKLRSDQSKTSVHLAILRQVNLVIANREGKKVFYSINYDQLSHVKKMAEQLLKNTA